MTQATPRSGDLLLLVGTRKGLFVFHSNPERREWQQTMHHPGWMVHASAYDPRDGMLYAATNSEVFGGIVQRSADLGASWESECQGLKFDDESGFKLRKIWQVACGARAGEVYAGSERAGIFRSEDRGATWQGLDGLNQHPHAASWEPGGGGLCLHTIVRHPSDPDRLWVAISTGGVYRSDDGGQTWQPRNQGIAAGFLPDPNPEYGQCVHKIDRSTALPERLYAQNHGGVYRSDDGGDTWLDIAPGLPSDFGFPLVVHPHDPDTVYVLPLAGDTQRFVPEGRMAVWRSRDRGEHWQALSEGLPADAYLVILRDAMATDDCDIHGIYAGTTTGQLYYSRDEGEHWECLADHLPPVYSVVAARMP
jgi:photosystem II stability/assembly factor-like uncharacterized protein